MVLFNLINWLALGDLLFTLLFDLFGFVIAFWWTADWSAVDWLAVLVVGSLMNWCSN